jgi:quinol monooxygenase YgiN
MSVNVIVKFNVIDESLEEFRTLMDTVKANLPNVEGCNGVEIYTDKSNASVFILVENWTSEEFHKKHIAGVIESGDWKKIRTYLREDAESGYFVAF